MARRTSRPKLHPDPPLGPSEFDPAPAAESGAVWDCVVADSDTVVPEHVADWKVQESRFVDVDLSGRSLGGLRVRDTTFERCDLSGAVLDGAALERVAFVGCRLTGTVLSGTTLTDVRIAECSANLLVLRMARATTLLAEDTSLRGADLHEFDGPGCGFLRCDLTEASFTSATLTGTRLHGSTIADVQDPLALRGTVIDPGQQIVVGAALLAALNVQVTDA